jgi:hypothetical protein
VGKKKENKIITQDSYGDKVVVIHTYPRFFEWVGNIGITIADNKYIKWVFLAFLAALAVIQNPQSSGGDYDFFFHLKYGEIYLKNLTWKLDHSQFSWTPSDADWPYVTWIGNILIYLFYNIASGNGVLILQWSVYLGLFFMLVKYIHAAGDRLDITYILLALITITALSLVDIFIKPDLLTTLFFGLTVFIYIYTKTTGQNLFYAYPVLFLIWTNTHGGFVNGLFFISLALTGELVNTLVFKKAAINKRLLYLFFISVCLSYLATLINPYGIKYHIFLYENMFSKEAYESLAKPLFAYVSLWKHVFSTQAYKFTNGAWSLLFMECVVICLFVYGLVKKKMIDFSLVLTTTAFFFFSMSMARAVKFSPIVSFFVIICMIKLTDLKEAKKKLGVAAIVIFLLLAGRITYQSFWYSSELPSWDYSKLLNETPQDVVKFVRDNKLPGPIYNDYIIGGYLLWALYPDYKVFIDPRQGLYAKHTWPDFQKYANTAPFTPEKLKEFTDKYPFKIAIIHYAYFSQIQWLLSSPDWKLLFFDRVAAVIIHKSVVPTLGKQALSTEAGTVRFLNVKRSDILLNLFNFYVNVGPQFARDIIEIYRRNVNNLYVFKQQNIQYMEQALQQKLIQIQQQQQQQIQQQQIQQQIQKEVQQQLQKQQMTK